MVNLSFHLLQIGSGDRQSFSTVACLAFSKSVLLDKLKDCEIIDSAIFRFVSKIAKKLLLFLKLAVYF